MPTLLVGRGLLGGRLLSLLRRHGEQVHTVDVEWNDHTAAVTALRGAVAEVRASGGAWRIAWCAGSGVVASRPEDLDREVRLFEDFVDGLDEPPEVFFLASSAGGVYAGSPDVPPYTESSPVRALVPYGEAKLAMEAAVGVLAARGGRVAVGRIANLYGPGQDLTKPQGLVSQLCLAQVARRPLTVYVSLDTLRDYLYVADAAAMAAACLDRAAATPAGTTTTKILASGQALSVGALVAECTRAFRRRPQIATRPTVAQARDLRMRSVVWTEVDALARTPLVVGLRATAEDVAARQRTGALARELTRGAA